MTNEGRNLGVDSVLSGENAAYLEEILLNKIEAVNHVDTSLLQYLRSMPGVNADVSHSAVIEQIRRLAQNQVKPTVSLGGELNVDRVKKYLGVVGLIRALRHYGHLHAKTDPLNLKPRVAIKELDLSYYGLSEQDFGLTLVDKQAIFGQTLGELFKNLHQIYCSHVGFEYMHIQNEAERLWWQNKIEAKSQPLTQKQQIAILDLLTSAEIIEKHIGSKYPGAKRFSLEGGEALIVIIDEIIQRSGAMGVKEVVIGMAHRGRLNVLVNNLGKDPSELFAEFEGKHSNHLESGDVKYHQGFSSDVATKGGVVHLSLSFNPSHLEIVSPVALGSVRARQTRRNSQACSEVVPIIVHGDAAFAGQGVVMETFAMSQTRGYSVCGSIHVVVNNQIGFTTSNPLDTRSSVYATDIAKMVDAPIIHVNADCPEEVLRVIQFAVDFRMEFKRDVVIDLICYRRHGHNEADEPAVTQPLMYQIIRKHPTIRQQYADALMKQGIIDSNTADKMVLAARTALDTHKRVAKNVLDNMTAYVFDWKPYVTQDWSVVDTTVPLKKLTELSNHFFELSSKINLHSRVAKIVEDRHRMGQGDLALDWGCAEMLAYASLLSEEVNVRISGQDCGRGTFFHRHAVLHDQSTGAAIIPVADLPNNKAKFDIFDSLLSEEAVMAFEYGYAAADPNTLVIWEAQFGDFANGAQVVIDQFVSSGEHKWGRFCALTLLLPHGYEGMGPEHSSARLERFLQLCAEKNIQVCVPSTPAQIFHLLRRQMLRKIRKPLIVMSPKSLLRHKLAISSLEELSSGSFKEVIADSSSLDNNAVTRIIICSGKAYYDLLHYRETNKITNTAILRLEQLYPFEADKLKYEIRKYPNATDIVWCQEEPKNQGAWYSTRHNLEDSIDSSQKLRYAGRKASSAPSTGYHSMHEEEEHKLLMDAFLDVNVV